MNSVDELVIENNVRMIMRYQIMLVSHLDNALKSGRIDEHTFTRLKSQGCIAQTHNEILDHFERIFHELLAYYQDRLRERIVKGAEFIDSLSSTDPRRKSALDKYDRLCEQLRGQEIHDHHRKLH